jgi:hypothetical protein
MKPNEEIFTLIASYLEGTEISEQEISKLKRWIDSSPPNKNIYNKCKNIYFSGKKFKLIDNINSDYAWEVFSKKIQDFRKPLIYSILKYAVILLPILGLSLFFLFSLNQFLREPNNKYSSFDEIYSGKRKAVLTLATGKKINLGAISKIVSSNSQHTIHSDSLGFLKYKVTGLKKEEYNSLYVEKACNYKLFLSDGTIVWLNSDSEIEYPIGFTEEKRKVILRGEAYFEVSKDKEKPFIVSTPEMDIEVLGTEFNINTYDDKKNVELLLVEGSVSYHVGGCNGVLEPGELIVYNKTGQFLDIKKEVDITRYTSWKNGVFSFEKMDLEKLSKEINRWFNVKVVFDDLSVKEQIFTGAIEKDKSLKFLVEILEATNTVQCTLKRDALHIGEKK